MKKLSKISLHNLSQAELAKREENLLRGGDNNVYLPCVCIVGCTCLYAGEQEGPDDPYYGGSSKEESGKSNNSSYQATGDLGV